MLEAVQFVSYLLDRSVNIMERIFTELNGWGIVFSAFFTFVLYRFLLRPIMGGLVSASASDKVRKIRKDNKERG